MSVLGKKEVFESVIHTGDLLNLINTEVTYLTKARLDDYEDII